MFAKEDQGRGTTRSWGRGTGGRFEDKYRALVLFSGSLAPRQRAKCTIWVQLTGYRRVRATLQKISATTMTSWRIER